MIASGADGSGKFKVTAFCSKLLASLNASCTALLEFQTSSNFVFFGISQVANLYNGSNISAGDLGFEFGEFVFGGKVGSEAL